MRALIKSKPGTGLELASLPVPDIGPMDVLIRISRTAICGTDLHIWQWDPWAQKTIPTPMTVGHEYCGYVEKIGSGVTDLSPGDYVSGEGHLVCGRCRNCLAGRRHLCPNTVGVGVNRPGAFADFLVLPYRNVYKLDPAIPENLAAIFDPLGNAIHTALSWDLVAEDVLITGAGPIGCMAAAVCRFAGARHVVITDPNPFRLDLAKQLGATRTVDINEECLGSIKEELGMKEGFDIALEMSGHPAGLSDILEHTSHGARVSLLGIFSDKLEIDFENVIFKGLILKGIYGREIFETWYKMGSMVRAGLDPSAVITHEFDAPDFEKAFQTMLSGKSGKVILNWS
ncbi:MAG TPA: L-threonine 3-dehydrogenase [Verrucomicrobiales bacterium]|nr:L-threonine 3-dehydrogenase [Verrucomicrobiales bacterium]